MITPRLIKSLIETEANVNDISIKTRKRVIVELRFCYFLLTKTYCVKPKLSLEEIGSVVKRDHATVLHGIKVIKNNLGKKIFTANNVYDKVNKKLLELFNSDINEEDIMKFDDVFMVNQYWRIKHIKITEKSHAVINNYVKRVKKLEDRLKIYDDDTVYAINNLNSRDLKIFKERNRIFFKVTEQLNNKV